MEANIEKYPKSWTAWHTGTQSYYTAEGNSLLEAKDAEMIPQAKGKYVSS